MSFRSFATSALAAVALAAVVPTVAPARSHPTPTPTVSPTPPPEDMAITAMVRREFVAWQNDLVDKSRYAAETQAMLTDDKIAQTSKALSALGALQQIQWVGPAAFEDPPPPGTRGYMYRMICSRASVFMRFVLNPDGKIDGIFFFDKMQ